MSLTSTDLQEIRSIVRDEVKPLAGRLEALESDVKEIYFMLRDMQGSTITDKKFQKLSLEDKLLKINAELLATARQAGITLPR